MSESPDKMKLLSAHKGIFTLFPVEVQFDNLKRLNYLKHL